MKYGFAALLAGVGLVVGVQAAEQQVFVYSVMKDSVAPQAQILWDVGNAAIDDDGNPSVAKLTAADWTKLGGAAQAMKTAALSMADAPSLAVAPAGVKIQDEGGAGGGATAKQIQGYIDANPAEFRNHARALADVSEAFATASKTRDAKTLADASGMLDQVCEACHAKYWYPQQ